jgi:hypothetical protein
VSYPIVYPYQSGTAFTDGGRAQGDWQTNIMAPVTGATVTTNQNKTGVVDGQGRVATAYESRARTATPTSYSLYSRGARGLTVYISATAITSTPSVVVTIDGYDPVSATWFNLLTSAAIATVSTKKMVVFPGIAEVANLSVSTIIPDTVRVVMTHGNANSITYSVDLDWMQ